MSTRFQLGVRPDDPEEVRLDKAMFTLVSSLLAVMAFAWVGIYLALGLPRSAAIPFAYQLCVVAALIVLWKTGQLRIVRTALLVLMLVLPFALQWSLGGFASGSAVAAWASITPVLAYLLGARSGVWLGGFLALLVVSAAAESTLAADAPTISDGVRAGFFAMNLAGPAVAGVLSLSYFTNQRDEARAALEAEQARSERLLLNILPATIADQLRTGATTIADNHPDVSVLFADIVDFTPLAGQVGADALVTMLNDVFTTFDDLVETAGLEKIKTIGDAYMVVGGLPTSRSDHLTAVLKLAVAMQDAASTVVTPHETPVRLRIGIDTGPVVAGVIGKRKFSYDVWGDTVNTASRMESHGVPGRIQVTQRVADRAGGDFAFEPQGPVAIKGIGETPTFLLARSVGP